MMKIVRRTHMYAGLVMLPWLLLFGISGMLFNHPNVGQDVRGQPVRADDLQANGGLRAWEPQAIASEVVRALNASADGGKTKYALDPEFTPEFAGFTVLTAPAPGGQHTLILDMQQTRGVLVTRKAPPVADGHAFAGAQVSLPEFSPAAVERQVTGLLAARKLDALGELRAHPKIAPELRFRVRDADQTLWNLTYDVRTGTVSGRRSDSFPNIGVTELLSKMHTTHHFPLQFGSLWLWALFEDLLGISMVVWAISGLFMWWQMKPTRVIGVVSLTVALGIAAMVMGGTASHLTFGDVRPAMGPGE